MLTTNKLDVDLIDKKEFVERIVKDPRKGLQKIITRKKPLTSITTKDINSGPLTAKGTPEPNYYPSITTRETPFPESITARKKRMAAIEKEVKKKKLAVKAQAVINEKGTDEGQQE